MKSGLLTTQIILVTTASLWIFCSAGPTSDPCTGTTCGTGAECRLRSHLVVCVCPEGTEGDPFVECKLMTSTVDTTTSAGSDFRQSEATTLVHDILKMSPSFNLSPTKSDRNYTPQGHGGDGDPAAYFPSAPPTLSHYAHAPPFSQPHSNGLPPDPPQRPTENQYPYHNPHNQQAGRDRLHNSFHGNVNPDFISGSISGDKSGNIPLISTSLNNNSGNENGFNIPDRIQQAPFERHSEQSQRHGGLQQFPPHSAPIPTNNHNGPNRIPPQQHPFNPHQQHPPTHFNLKQEHQIPHQRQELAKDPLGIYIDCLTINNRVVCADTTSRHDLHPPHLAPPPQQLNQWNQGFEHRLIAVGNENKNTFHAPQPTRLEVVMSNGVKGKPGQAHLRPMDERPHFQPGHHHTVANGPLGTVNLFPSASSSAEVQSDVLKINHDAQPQQHTFSETKPFAPQPGTEEAKLCQQMCGEGSVCRVFHNRAICGCPEGHTGDPAKKCFLEPNSKFDPNSCQRQIECPSTMVCLNSQCTDPCLIKNTFDTSNVSSFHDSLDAAPNKNENMCGPNSKCTVIEHTQLCSCEQNYYGNPYIGCVQ